MFRSNRAGSDKAGVSSLKFPNPGSGGSLPCPFESFHVHNTPAPANQLIKTPLLC